MATRRGFLSGLLAAGLTPLPGWADAGAPAFLSAAQMPDGSYMLVGLDGAGAIRFRQPLPERGHAAAAHPLRPEAVAFARRPGRFALVIDCAGGALKATLDAPEGRHFYGHGAFSPDGALLFTTENDYAAARGVIGVWDVASGYTRIDEFDSGGTGPHEMRLMPDGETLVIANGGIETHPDAGREKLNIPFMKPNLAYAGLDGRLAEVVELPPALNKNSIRHLALSGDGLVGFAMQWQGDTRDAPAVLGLHRRGSAPRLLQGGDHARLEGYAGSVAMTPDGAQVAISSPRGGLVQVFDTSSGALLREVGMADVCGLACDGGGFLVTSGLGRVGRLGEAGTQQDLRFDNHLVPVG
ncbi:DUF1513 domain-containing protein [Mesobacterium pallidum]|uniref:DUF1513 domain-containing protein n=1 Tax=Mesobacterium pallidum TaxID=2872037 RepID=UPI001EE2A868|nr:DUF1513 domain-containing protein [Mesobacterium pallidum]